MSSTADLMPVIVAVCVVMASLIAVLGSALPRRVTDALTLATALAVTTLATVLLCQGGTGRRFTWLGNWIPHHGAGVGIAFAFDPLSGGLAVLIAALASCSLLFSWHYLDAAGGHFQALILFFLAGMEGFVFSADLFDMVVFFELMGAAAYALTAFHIEDRNAVEGGLNFGLMNSLGAYLSLAGLAILYSRVGQLGLPQLGVALGHHRPDALVVTSFVLIVTGFMVKGALAPFHFWLADAHAVAPAPICVLFSGVMVELGLYGVARIYWTIYGDALPHEDIRRAFIVIGTLTAVVGAVMCLAQRHLKRLLAFSTIAHMGLFTLGFAVLTSDGMAGTAVYVLGHAGVKAALFLIAGLLLDRYGTVDELELHGRALDQKLSGALFLLGALALAGLPPFGTALGKSIGEDAASTAGYPWISVLFIVVSALTGGAVLRFGARAYLGLGDRPEDPDRSEATSGDVPREDRLSGRTPITMLTAIVVLLLGGLAIGLVPDMGRVASDGAQRLLDGSGYAQQLLSNARPAPLGASAGTSWTTTGIGLGLLSTALALTVAALGLWRRRLAWLNPMGRVMSPLHRVHSGHIGDYVTWMFAGMALLVALIGLPLA